MPFAKNSVLPSLFDALMMGLGFTTVLVLLGAIREALGQGVLFANMDLLFGPVAASWKITLVQDHPNSFCHPATWGFLWRWGCLSP